MMAVSSYMTLRRFMISRRLLEPVVVVAFALAAMGSVLFDVNPVLRLALAIPLVLALPGYALLSAVFSGSPGLSAPERVLFTLGASAAIAVIGGLALNSTPWGLRADSWA